MNKTFMANNQTVQHNWYVVDANGLTLGRLATAVASLLRGKHKVTYTPHVNCGDNVIVINADKIKLTGNKWEDKLYRYHSEYSGGLRTLTAKEVMTKYPTRMVEEAVFGMLPHTKLGDQMRKQLYVYASGEHPHAAQKPVEFKVKA
ncbi:MAG: 50S ribosomal protein L13 [Acholeplasmatales bacterium]|nr:50S ribosomal protein L13 [Acholeplasmatales bacterium]